MTTDIRKDYFDIDLSFEPTMDRDIGGLVGDRAINAGIHNYCVVRKEEKLFDPDFGLGIDTYLFEIDVPSNLLQIKSLIESFIKQGCPRVREAVVEGEQISQNDIKLDIHYIRTDIGTLENFKLFLPVYKG